MAIVWNRVTWYSKLLAVILFVGVFALGLYLGAAYNEATHYSVQTLPSATSTVSTLTKTSSSGSDTKVTPSAPVSNSKEIRFSAYLTAYTYWDNTPPGSSVISNPVIHTTAGGSGAYSDPITVAVGHSIAGAVDALDYPAGTRFYVPNLRKYFIVEDTCGDGPTPQNGPCHTGYQGHPWLDLWIDGGSGTSAAANTCAEDITDIHTVIENPASNYAVTPGPVYDNGCSSQYGDSVASS